MDEADYDAIYGRGGARDPHLGTPLVGTRRPGIELVVAAHKSVAVLGIIGLAEHMHAILDAETDATLEFLDTWFARPGSDRRVHSARRSGNVQRVTEKPTPELSERLLKFADELKRELGASATVEPMDAPGRGFSIMPSRDDALGVKWIDFGFEIILDVDGGLGGRWELESSDDDIDMLQAIVRSVIAGRVREVRALRRSSVTVTLEDGRDVTETGAVAPEGCLPLPFWRRWGRRIEYAPYRP